MEVSAKTIGVNQNVENKKTEVVQSKKVDLSTPKDELELKSKTKQFAKGGALVGAGLYSFKFMKNKTYRILLASLKKNPAIAVGAVFGTALGVAIHSGIGAGIGALFGSKYDQCEKISANVSEKNSGNSTPITE